MSETEKHKTKEQRSVQQGPVLLKITPSILQYEPPYNRIIVNVVTLKNLTTNLVAFKVKTTAPKRYAVRPNIGFIEPQATIDVQVHLTALPDAETPPKEKDRFQIQSIDLSTVPPTQTDNKDVWKTVLDSQVSKQRLKVRFGTQSSSTTSSTTPSSSFHSASDNLQRHVVVRPPDVNEKSEAALVKGKEDLAVKSNPLDDLQSQLKKLASEKEKLAKENETLSNQNRRLMDKVRSESGSSIIDLKLIVLAIICLLLGYYLRGSSSAATSE